MSTSPLDGDAIVRQVRRARAAIIAAHGGSDDELLAYLRRTAARVLPEPPRSAASQKRYPATRPRLPR